LLAQADKIGKIVAAANVEVAGVWPTLFARALKGRNVDDFISAVGSAGAAPAAAAPAAAAPAAGGKKEEKKEEKKPEPKKEEKKEESDEDMGFGTPQDPRAATPLPPCVSHSLAGDRLSQVSSTRRAVGCFPLRSPRAAVHRCTQAPYIPLTLLSFSSPRTLRCETTMAWICTRARLSRRHPQVHSRSACG
jgi:large subunit ribosomal protein LP1